MLLGEGCDGLGIGVRGWECKVLSDPVAGTQCLGREPQGLSGAGCPMETARAPVPSRGRRCGDDVERM